MSWYSILACLVQSNKYWSPFLAVLPNCPQCHLMHPFVKLPESFPLWLISRPGPLPQSKSSWVLALLPGGSSPLVLARRSSRTAQCLREPPHPVPSSAVKRTWPWVLPDTRKLRYPRQKHQQLLNYSKGTFHSFSPGSKIYSGERVLFLFFLILSSLSFFSFSLY